MIHFLIQKTRVNVFVDARLLSKSRPKYYFDRLFASNTCVNVGVDALFLRKSPTIYDFVDGDNDDTNDDGGDDANDNDGHHADADDNNGDNENVILTPNPTP
ncbi:MAG: hypothetical protein VX704_05765 [Verrucomicrobiota bacterium]|nr:hypothetical protein [Verrucomicrobiota bacterium]